MSEVVTREMTLREKAQEWLKNYKGAGNAYGGNILSLEEMATIVAEYLHETPNGAEGTSERVEALQTEIEELRKVATEEKTHCEEFKDCIRTMEKEIAYRRGQVDAYEFVFYRNRANNRASGAEVRQ